ncbi:MAG: InlB B-repeat-containing protein [Oscillospiraceae bacterium]|nr:InlB B-repeat-containing protein [Oscillospiraceae bacterium]
MEQQNVKTSESKTHGRKWLLPIVVILVLAMIGVGGLFVCRALFTYTVSFDCGEGAYYLPEEQRVLRGHTVSRPPFPACEGQRFTGWYTDADGNDAYDFTRKIRGDLVLYAGWVPEDSPEAQLTEEEMAQFEAALDAIGDVASPFTDSAGYINDAKDRQVALDAVETYVKSLVDQGVIVYYERTDDLIYMEFDSCLTCFYAAKQEGVSSVGESSILAVQPFVKTPNQSSYHLGDVWSPVARLSGESIMDKIGDYDSITTYNENAVTLVNMAAMPWFSQMLLWVGHGNYVSSVGPVLLTAERSSRLELTEIAEGMSGKRYTICIEGGKYYYAITSEFVRRQMMFDQALVYLDTCKSGYTDDLAKAFCTSGAQTVFYHRGTDEIYTWYSDLMMNNILCYMNGNGFEIKDGQSTGKIDPVFHTAGEALELAEEWMAIYLKRTTGKTYERSTYIVENGKVIYQNSSVGLYGESDYTLCSGIKARLTSSNGTVDLSKVALKLVGGALVERVEPGETIYFDKLQPGVHDIDVYYNGEVIKTVSKDVFSHRYVATDIDLTLSTVSGRVLDSETGAAISGAEITCRVADCDRTGTTDGNGYFSVKDVPSGLCGITVSAKDYTPREDITISIAPGEENVSLDDILLEPYIPIYSVEELDAVRDAPSGRYKLMQDLDLSECENWVPIGTEGAPFTGVFDGNGHTITGLEINYSGTTTFEMGLFGVISQGTICHLNVVGTVRANLTTSETAFAQAGGIAGWMKEDSVIERCSFIGSVEASVQGTGFARAAGICAIVDSGCQIRDCYADVQISACAEDSNTMVGGIAAWLNRGTIQRCWVSGSLSSEKTGNVLYMGGIAASGEEGFIKDCAVLLDQLNGTPLLSFSDAVSFTGKREDCFVIDDIGGDRSLIFQLIHRYPTISEAQACEAATYTVHGWDFEAVWYMPENGYPSLR